MSAVTIRRIVVRGRVQGVGYRAWVADEADARNLEGWVRNCRDGSVEALFAGPADVVAAMIAACRRGPSLARVSAVQEEDGVAPVGPHFAEHAAHDQAHQNPPRQRQAPPRPAPRLPDRFLVFASHKNQMMNAE